MKLFILNTQSESGDSYSYQIQHPTKPTNEELERFLSVHGSDCDKSDGPNGFCYEGFCAHSDCIEITTSLTIPTIEECPDPMEFL